MREGWMGNVDFSDKFPPAKIEIDLDLNALEPIGIVIHELIHVVMSELVLGKFDESLEEVIVLGLDKYIYDWVKASPARKRKWQTLLDKKLAETAATELEPLSFEKLATRPPE